MDIFAIACGTCPTVGSVVPTGVVSSTPTGVGIIKTHPFVFVVLVFKDEETS